MHKLPTENLYFNMKKMKKLSLFLPGKEREKK